VVSDRESRETRKNIKTLKNSKLDHVLVHKFVGTEEIFAIVEGEPVRLGRTKTRSFGG